MNKTNKTIFSAGKEYQLLNGLEAFFDKCDKGATDKAILTIDILCRRTLRNEDPTDFTSANSKQSIYRGSSFCSSSRPFLQ